MAKLTNHFLPHQTLIKIKMRSIERISFCRNARLRFIIKENIYVSFSGFVNHLVFRFITFVNCQYLFCIIAIGGIIIYCSLMSIHVIGHQLCCAIQITSTRCHAICSAFTIIFVKNIFCEVHFLYCRVCHQIGYRLYFCRCFVCLYHQIYLC